MVMALAWTLPAPAQTLKEAIQRAIDTNPDVQASASRRWATSQELNQALGSYRPRVDLVADFGAERIDTAESRLAGRADDTMARHGGGVSVSQMLFDGGGVKGEVSRQRARVSSSTKRVSATAEEIGMRATDAYLEVLRRQESANIATENLAAHQSIYDLIKERTDRAIGRRADLFQAEGRLALAQATLREEQAGLRDAQAAFARQIGMQPSRLLRPEYPNPALLAAGGASLRQALVDHPAIKAAESDVAAAEAAELAAHAALSPRFDLEVGANLDRNGISGRSEEYTAVVRMRYNLSRGGMDQARVQQTRHLTQEARALLNSTRRDIEENLALAWNAYQSAQDRAALLKRYVESSGATRLAYSQQFSIGQRTLLDLLNAENERASARGAYASAQYAQLAASYRISFSMGHLLELLGVSAPEAASSPSATVRP